MSFYNYVYLTSITLSGFSCGVLINRWRKNSFKTNFETVRATSLSEIEAFRDSWIQEMGFPRDEKVMKMADYTSAYDYQTRIPRWVMECLTSQHMEYFRDLQYEMHYSDDRILPQFQSTLGDYPSRAEFHGPPDKIETGCLASPINHNRNCVVHGESFCFCNAAPMYRAYNMGNDIPVAKRFREDVIPYHEPACIISGPLFLPQYENSRKYLKYKVLGENNVAMPTQFFRVFMFRGESEGDYVQLYTKSPNVDTPQEKPIMDEVTKEEFEKESGLVLSEKLANAAD